VSEQPVEIHDSDPAWPARFADERDSVERILAPWLVAPVEHAGSTSVPGLPAKPVVDMFAGVASLEESRPCIELLSGAGWCYAPYAEEIEHWFCKPSPAARTHHLHVMVHGSPDWNDILAFRDALRSDAGLCERYAALKRELAVRHRDDREAYTEAKAGFIAAALASIAPPS
jgi:GrpB-like predicted nucleotidyltransferase (UPF0157 family)